MKSHLADLVQRRRLLVKKIAAQRRELAQISTHFERPLAWVDNGWRVAHYLYERPTLLASGVAALLSLRRTGLFGLVQSGLSLLFRNPEYLSWAWQYLSRTTKK